mmetsp:Transcript_33898/g.74193  ORF Transcript_33898/g.74193 Transcript_33898/m.74193 type:complete len:346 (+) Transcript_33898:1-1038(+)
MIVCRSVFVLALLALVAADLADGVGTHHRHHRKQRRLSGHRHVAHNRNHRHHAFSAAGSVDASPRPAEAEEGPQAPPGLAMAPPSEEEILHRVRHLESELGAQEVNDAVMNVQMRRGSLRLNGPLPADFSERFAQAAWKACGSDQVQVLDATLDRSGYVEMTFQAPAEITESLEDQAADPDSRLANGPMRRFLVEEEPVSDIDSAEATEKASMADMAEADEDETADSEPRESGIDVDSQMPYGDMEPFGREDTAQELTEESIKDSNAMVDQFERAEVAEEKRAMFRALTRLRGAAISSFDGIARAQASQIDEYNKAHRWRDSHPLHHLADEESDVDRWAFPDESD